MPTRMFSLLTNPYRILNLGFSLFMNYKPMIQY